MVIAIKFKSNKVDYPESFFHYILGYAYPAIALILKKNDFWEKQQYLIEPYGEIMDSKFIELFNIIEMPYSFLEDNSQSSIIYPKRWDEFLGLLNYCNHSNNWVKLKLSFKLLLTDFSGFSMLIRKKNIFKENMEKKPITVNKVI